MYCSTIEKHANREAAILSREKEMKRHGDEECKRAGDRAAR
jgi:hypothetical protein